MYIPTKGHKRLHVYKGDIEMSCALWKKGLMHLKNTIGPGHPAQSAKAELGRNVLPLVRFLQVQGPVCLVIQSAFNSFPNDSSKLKELADDNFEFDKICRKFSK